MGALATFPCLQSAAFWRTSLDVRSRLVLRHSSRSLRWKPSAYPFWMGRPGWMCGSTLNSLAQPPPSLAHALYAPVARG